MKKDAGNLSPLVPWGLIVLTITTGTVDAVSYLRLGHVFVANMTGNVVFLGFAAAGARDISAPGSLVAMAGFLIGAFGGGALVRRSSTNAHLLLQATAVKFVLSVLALVLTILFAVHAGTPSGYALTALLALATGVQNAAVRKLGVPDFTTTVLTLTLTGVAADYPAGTDPKLGRRLTSVIAMFAGALLGAALVLRSGLVAALSAIVVLFAVSMIAAGLTQRRLMRAR